MHGSGCVPRASSATSANSVAISAGVRAQTGPVDPPIAANGSVLEGGARLRVQPGFGWRRESLARIWPNLTWRSFGSRRERRAVHTVPRAESHVHEAGREETGPAA